MGFTLTAAGYVDYLCAAAEVIGENGDYITGLDAKTGDGDHWVNLNMGFGKIVEQAEALRAMPLPELLRQVGMTMMNGVGGSSGVLYGGAYVAAAKAVADREALDARGLLTLLEAMLQSIMARGKAEPGQKTMIDSLHGAVEAYRRALDAGEAGEDALRAMKAGARAGAEATRDMPAVKGRASYQTDRGVGELDPGAVTMSMQLACLADTILQEKG